MSDVLIVSLTDAHASLLLATGTRKGMRVLKARVVDLPESERSAEPEDVGRWLRKVADEAGIKATAVVFGESRQGSVSKVLTFDGVEDLKSDLPGMVRLQMIRQVSFPAEEAVIDYVVHDQEQDRVEVRAAAITQARVDWYRSIARGAGWKLRRISLRTSGIGALVRLENRPGDHASLYLAPGCAECEMLVINSGRTVFSRSVILPRGENGAETSSDDAIRRLTTEARRTWMSYRVAADTTTVESLVVIGDGGDLAASCGQDLALPVRTLDPAQLESVAWDCELDDPAEQLILAGLAAEDLEGAPVIDFAHPRRAPDRRAAMRQRILVGILIFIAIVGTGFTWQAKQLGSHRAERDLLRDRRNELRNEKQEVLRGEVLAEHVRRWTEGETDWLAHMQVITDMMPASDYVVLDGLTGTSDAAVDYRGRSRAEYDAKHWESLLLVRFRIEGRGVDRDITNAIREALVNDRRYRADTLGDDTAARRSDRYGEAFGLSLTTQLASPVTSETSATPVAISDGQGGQP